MSGHPSRHGADDDILGLPSNWARVSLVCSLLLIDCAHEEYPGLARHGLPLRHRRSCSEATCRVISSIFEVHIIEFRCATWSPKEAISVCSRASASSAMCGFRSVRPHPHDSLLRFR